MVAEVVGVLDAPLLYDPAGHPDGTQGLTTAMPGGVLEVQGWVLFDGLPADRVEVYVGDQPARPARRGLPRRDLADLFHATPAALAAGFFAAVVVPRSAAGEVLDVRVRAFSELGDTWHSPPSGSRSPGSRRTATTRWPRAAGCVPSGPAPPGDGRLRICVFTHSLHLAGGELYLDELLRRLTAPTTSTSPWWHRGPARWPRVWPRWGSKST